MTENDSPSEDERPVVLVWAIGFTGGLLAAATTSVAYNGQILLAAVMAVPVLLSTAQIFQWNTTEK